MSEQAIINAAITTLTPIAAAILEDLHQAASAEIARLEASLPTRIAAAEQDVQDWALDAVTTIHGLIARIAAHQGQPPAPVDAVPPTPPAAASTPPPPTASASAPTPQAASSTPGIEAAK